MSDTARTAAYTILRKIDQKGAWSNLTLGSLTGMSSLDKAFTTALVLGVTERRRALDTVIQKYASRKPDNDLLNLLRLGVYQILYMDRVPDSAACNETVSIANQSLGKPKANFVNAVLRSVCREKDSAVGLLQSAPVDVRCSFDPDLASLLREQYPEQYEEILESFCMPKPLYLFCNTLKSSPEELIASFGGKADGNRIRLDEKHAEAIADANSGRFIVQGFGSQQAVRMLDAKPGNCVIDVCACPGGKSFGAAISMQNRGSVYSFDIHENKLSLIHKGAENLGISILQTAVRDGRNPDESLFGKADRVICDVPCSGLGVIGAKPEIRYKKPEVFESLYGIQRDILQASVQYLKKGGILVYSTCTLNKKENEEIIQHFLSENTQFTLLEEHTFLPCGEGGEGFYAAKMIKND